MALYRMDIDDYDILPQDTTNSVVTFDTVIGQRANPVPIQDEDRWYAPIAERDAYFQQKSLESENEREFHLFPNQRDPKTVMALAVVTSNAYTLPPKKDWMSIDPFGLRLVKKHSL